MLELTAWGPFASTVLQLCGCGLVATPALGKITQVKHEQVPQAVSQACAEYSIHQAGCRALAQHTAATKRRLEKERAMQSPAVCKKHWQRGPCKPLEGGPYKHINTHSW
jgi:hypothetical protein